MKHISVGAFMKNQLSLCPSPRYYPDLGLIFILWWLSDGSSPPGPQWGPRYLFWSQTLFLHPQRQKLASWVEAGSGLGMEVLRMSMKWGCLLVTHWPLRASVSSLPGLVTSSLWHPHYRPGKAFLPLEHQLPLGCFCHAQSTVRTRTH